MSYNKMSSPTIIVIISCIVLQVEQLHSELHLLSERGSYNDNNVM